MLKRLRCECGFSVMLEHHEFYDKRIRCPRCGTIKVHMHPPAKCMEVFENALRQLAHGNAEDAVLGFGRGYELYLKHVLLQGRYHVAAPRLHGREDVPRLAQLISKRFTIPCFTPIKRRYRNEIEHDTRRLATKAEALEYAEHVVVTMEQNLRELLPNEILIRGYVGQLNVVTDKDSDEHASAAALYWYHLGEGNIGYVRTLRAWLEGYKVGAVDWELTSWR